MHIEAELDLVHSERLKTLQVCLNKPLPEVLAIAIDAALSELAPEQALGRRPRTFRRRHECRRPHDDGPAPGCAMRTAADGGSRGSGSAYAVTLSESGCNAS